MTTQLERPDPETPAPEAGPPSGYNTTLLTAIAVTLVVLVALAVFLIARQLDRDDGLDAGAGATSSTASTESSVPPSSETTATSSSTSESSTASTGTSSSSTSSSPTSSTTASTITATTGTGQNGAVVWPAPGTSGFATPDEAARRFAIDLAGFRDPVLGEFQSGDARSGEIAVRPEPSGPVTTVLLRQAGADDSWWVIGAHSDDIIIDQPRTGDRVAGSFEVSGRARAFEGHVDVALHRHGVDKPIVTGFVTGRGDGVLGEFDEMFDVPAGTTGSGVLVLTAAGGDDGTAWTVAAVPVNLG